MEKSPVCVVFDTSPGSLDCAGRSWRAPPHPPPDYPLHPNISSRRGEDLEGHADDEVFNAGAVVGHVRRAGVGVQCRDAIPLLDDDSSRGRLDEIETGPGIDDSLSVELDRRGQTDEKSIVVDGRDEGTGTLLQERRERRTRRNFSRC